MDNHASATPVPQPQPPQGALMHDFKGASDKTPMLTKKLLVTLLVVALLGVGTGYVMAKSGVKTGIKSVDRMAQSSSIEKGKVYGSTDTEAFKDTAEGTVKEGGIDGEGQYHLVRPGGDSQNVYMTSSNVDLSQFIDHKVKVWGQTQKAEHAGWLMDVGRIEAED